jgi:ribosomal protein S18 acetylase RimI-like enzyme
VSDPPSAPLVVDVHLRATHPDAVAREAFRGAEAGASVVHVDVPDDGAAVAGIRRRCPDLVVVASTGDAEVDLARCPGGSVVIGPADDTPTPLLVAQAATGAAAGGRRVATPAEVRAWLELEPLPAPRYRLRPAIVDRDRAAVLRVLETSNMHHIPSAEMHDIDVGWWYVAEVDGAIVGVGGWEMWERDGEPVGKTTLLTVHPDVRVAGIGRALQELRMGMMRDAGARRVITNADRPRVIEWYERDFGYRKVGSIPKVMEFGLPDVQEWTTLEAPHH